MSKKTEDATSRREFLVLAGTVAPIAAALTAAGSAAEAAKPEMQSGKLQDTAHTRAYFDSARF